jgi:hypothetical protein
MGMGSWYQGDEGEYKVAIGIVVMEDDRCQYSDSSDSIPHDGASHKWAVLLGKVTWAHMTYQSHVHE